VVVVVAVMPCICGKNKKGEGKEGFDSMLLLLALGNGNGAAVSDVVSGKLN
jgi:hypothetical protein